MHVYGHTCYIQSSNPMNDVYTLMHAEAPSPPQELSHRVLEYYTNYSKVKLMWDSPDNNSQVDFYHYEVVYSLEGVSIISYNASTTNATAIISGIPYDTNTSFILNANNCEGKSAPVYSTLVIYRGI